MTAVIKNFVDGEYQSECKRSEIRTIGHPITIILMTRRLVRVEMKEKKTIKKNTKSVGRVLRCK